MRHDTRQYLASLDAETLITVIEGLCGFGGFDVNHGPDPCDGKPIVYGSHHLHGTFTLANVDKRSIDGCGCMQDPPCKGCSSDDAKYRLSLHLYFVRAVFESGGEAEYFVTACHEEDAIHRVYLKNVRDHEERAEFFATKIADEDSADPS